MLNGNDRERLDELCDLAKSYYIIKTDFKVTDWLTDDEAVEYESLVLKEEG